MTCSFTLSHDSKTHELFATRTAVSDTLEVWRVSSQLDPNTFIALSNDRPGLHKNYLFSSSFKWTVLEGDVTYQRMVSQITTYLEYHIKSLWKPPKKGKAAPKPEDSPQGKLF